MRHSWNFAPCPLSAGVLLFSLLSVGCTKGASDHPERTVAISPAQGASARTEVVFEDAVESKSPGEPLAPPAEPGAPAPAAECEGEVYHFLLVDSGAAHPYTFSGYPRADGVTAGHYALGRPEDVDPAFGPDWNGELPEELAREVRRLVLAGVRARSGSSNNTPPSSPRARGRRPAPDGLTLSYRTEAGATCQITGEPSQAWVALARRVRELGRSAPPSNP